MTILAALMRHWTRRRAAKDLRVALPPARAARWALRGEVRRLHRALGQAEVVDVGDVVNALAARRGARLPMWGGPLATYGRIQARRQILGLAYGFEAGLATHADVVRGRERDAWNPEGKHWSLTRQLLERRGGLVECLQSAHPGAEQEWTAVLDDLLDGLGQHPGLQDLVDYMIVHGARDPSRSFQGPAETDLARWTAWSMVRGFVLGADIIAHHASSASARVSRTARGG